MSVHYDLIGDPMVTAEIIRAIVDMPATDEIALRFFKQEDGSFNVIIESMMGCGIVGRINLSTDETIMLLLKVFKLFKLFTENA